MVLVVPYDPMWPVAFEELRASLLVAFAAAEDLPTRVEHVGSTSVPGLLAKPIIDIDVVVTCEDGVARAIELLRRAGYEHQGDLGIPGREAFRAPPDGGPARHLYVVVDGNQPYRDHVDLRDYLRKHTAEAREYATLKAALAARFPTDAPDDREAYTGAKADFIQGVLAAARRSPEK